MSKGWITLHRKLLDKPIWFESTPEQKTILITLLLMANHKEKEWEWQGMPYKAEPGQFVTSLDSIKKKCGKGISTQNIRTAIARFEKYGFLTNKSTKQNRLITIVNWGVYQEKNKELTKELTDGSQSANSQLTTNNNVNNENNVTNVVVVEEPQNVVQAYEHVFGMANSFMIESLDYWSKDLSPELVIAALKESAEGNAYSFKYTERIMKTWEKNNVKTLDDVEALNKKFEKQNVNKHQQSYQKQPPKTTRQLEDNSGVNY